MTLDHALSPRISFSHDLDQNGGVRTQPSPSDSSSLIHSLPSDFNFCVSRTIAFQELSTADEIFSGGKLLPLPVTLHKKPAITPPQSLPTEAAGSSKNCGRKKFKEFLSTSAFDADENEKPPPPQPPPTRPSNGKWFWKFGRSASLNCDSKRGRRMVRALHFLSRSKSAPTQNRRESRRSRHQKPPLKKSGRPQPQGGGVQVSPVLNLPPQYISRATMGLVELGSLLCNGSSREKKENEHSQIK